MDETVTDLLTGPGGVVVRVAAALLCAGLVVWVVTGVQFLGDEPRRQRLAVRLVAGAACLAVLAPVAVDPVAAVNWWIDALGSLGGRFAP